MYTAVSATGFTAVFVVLTPAFTFTFTKYLHLSSFEIAEKTSFALSEKVIMYNAAGE